MKHTWSKKIKKIKTWGLQDEKLLMMKMIWNEIWDEIKIFEISSQISSTQLSTTCKLFFQLSPVFSEHQQQQLWTVKKKKKQCTQLTALCYFWLLLVSHEHRSWGHSAMDTQEAKTRKRSLIETNHCCCHSAVIDCSWSRSFLSELISAL